MERQFVLNSYSFDAPPFTWPPAMRIPSFAYSLGYDPLDLPIMNKPQYGQKHSLSSNSKPTRTAFPIIPFLNQTFVDIFNRSNVQTTKLAG